MLSNEKIKQVFNAIKDNGINAFDDEALSKLLAILNEKELDEFEQRCYSELDGMDALKRVMDIRPMVEAIVYKDLYRIRESSLFLQYKDAIANDSYVDFFKSLRVDELADLKKYISFTIDADDEKNVTGSKKLINMITREIRKKEEMRKPRFEVDAT